MASTKELRDDVTKQALIEYVNRRHCGDALMYTPDDRKVVNPYVVKDGVYEYVEKRYASMDEFFKLRKRADLTPRIHAAYEAWLELMGELV